MAAGSSYVCRIRDNSDPRRGHRGAAGVGGARRAGVLRDIVVKLGTSHKAEARPNHPVRVILRLSPCRTRRRGGRKVMGRSPS